MPDFNGLNVPMISNTNLSPVDPALTENTQSSDVKAPAPYVPNTKKDSDLNIFSQASADSTWENHADVISGAELDANKRYKSYVPGINMEDAARWGQTGWERTKNAVDNLAEKTLSYTLQTAGFLGGAVAALGGGAVNLLNQAVGGDGKVINDGHAFSLMTDNFVDQLADVWKENVQERSPIYKSDKYSKGNIWDKLGTTDWWLDDAIDRLALTVATIAPGFLEAKGLGLFGTMMKGGSLEATGMGSKLIQSIANSGNDYSQLGKILTEKVIEEGTVAAEMSGTGAKYAVGTLGTNADKFKSIVHMAQFGELTTINATAQNALNARESQVAIKKALIEQRADGLNSFSDDEINNKAIEGGQDAFILNSPFALITSLIEVPQIYASTKAINKTLSKIFTGEVTEEGIAKLAEGAIATANTSGKGFLYNAAKVVGTGFEHGHSESLQVAIGRMTEEAKSGKIVEDDQGNKHVEYGDLSGATLWKEFIKNYSDPNGQNNLALGTIQGIITSLFGVGKSIVGRQTANQDKANNSFLGDLNNSIANRKFYYAMGDMLQKDEKGKVIITNGKATFDQNKLTQLGSAFAGTLINHAKILDAYGVLHSTDDVDKINAANKVIDDIKNESFQNLAYTFFQDAQGKETFQKLLKFESEKAKKEVNRQNDTVNGIEQTPDEILGKSLSMVDALHKVYNTIDQRYGTFLKLDNVDLKDKIEASTYVQFKENLKLQSFNDAAKTIWAKTALERNQIELATLGTDPASAEKANKIESQNKLLNDDIEKSATAYLLHTNKEAVQDTWNEEKDKLAERIKNEALEKELRENPPKKETIKVNTLIGPRDLEVGEEYYLGHIEKEDGSLGFPTLTILGKGEKEGTVKIKESNGTIRDIKEDELEKYRLGKVSEINKSENSRFYFRNIVQQPNTVVYWNIGKNNNKDNFYKDNKIPGKIQYDYKTDKLTFVYLNKKGEKVSKEIGLDMFHYDPSKFKEGIFSLDRSQTKEDIEDIAKRNASGKTKLDQASRRANRLKILSDLYTEVSSHQTKIKTTIADHKATLSKIATTLISKKITKQQLTALGVTSIKKLNTLKNTIENDIKILTDQSDTLDTELSYIQEMKDNIENYSEVGTEFLKEVEGEIKLTTELQTQIQTSIDELNGISKGIQGLITKLVSVLQKTLPDDTLGYTDAVKDWFNEIAAQDFTHFQDVKDFITDNTLLEGLEGKEEFTSISDSDLADINERISKLQEWYDEESLHLVTQNKILDRFKLLAKKYKQQKIQEKKVASQTEKINRSYSDQEPPVHERSPYEAPNKKSDFDVVNGSKPNPDRPPHQIRTDNFGIKWNKLTPEERKEFKIIDVTLNTEDQLGLGGLMKHLLKEETKDCKWNLIVARVIVNDEGRIVDQEGKEITSDPLNNVLVQVMPQPDSNGHLMAMYNGHYKTMFRATTDPAIVENIEEQYIKQRDEVLASKTLQTPKNFYMSFGSPIYEYEMDENGEIKKDPNTKKPIINYNTRTSVEDAELVTSAQLTTDNLVEVVTLSTDKHEGTVSMNLKKGFTLLRIPGTGIVKLFSRLLTNKESNTIFDVLVQLTKDLENNALDSVLSTKFKWLKSIVYWGIIKDDSGTQKFNKSNIYFKNVKDEKGESTPMLFIDKDSYVFTPDGLNDRKADIIDALQSIYHNIDAALTNSTTRAQYNEIVKVNQDGTLEVRSWQNYQTYLLSNKFVSSKQDDKEDGASRGDIPLTTPFKAIKDKGDINRKDFYISVAHDADDAIHATVKPGELAPKKVIITPLKNDNKPIAFGKKVEAEIPTTAFKLDGTQETVNIPNFGDTIFNLDAKKFIATNGVEGFAIVLPKDTSQAIIDAFAKQGRIITEDDARDVAASYILDKKFAAQLAEMSTPNKPDKRPFREQLARSARRFSPENWVDFESFLKANFPNLPTYRLKNIIQRTNGKQAWGMLQRGAIYVYENAGIGTGYHEVFEGVWKMFATPEEKVAILKEFRNSHPKYIDRFTNEEVDPKTATDQQIKEEIAEEFVDYILDGKAPERTTKRSMIGQMFHDLVNFIKTFFIGKDANNNTKKLFDKIGNGYYKEYIPYETNLSYAKVGIINIDRADPYNDSEFREKNEIPENQMNDIIQHLNYMTITSLIRNGDSIFNIDNISKNELYDMLKNDLLERIQWMRHLHEVNKAEGKVTEEVGNRKINDMVDLFHNVTDDWKNIVQTHIEYLKEKNIAFDENEIAVLNEDEDGVEKTNYLESNKIDSFKNMNSSVKLMLGTIPIIDPATGDTMDSTVGGVICLPAEQVNIQLLNVLSDATDPDSMFIKLGEYGLKKDINYRTLYSRIVGMSYKEGSVDFSNVDKGKLEIISEFWKSYKKQSPDAVTIFILPTGEAVVSNTMIKGASEVIKRDMFNNISDKIKKGLNYFTYNKSDGTYKSSEVILKHQFSKHIDSYINFLKRIGINFKPYEAQLRGQLLDNFKTIVTGIRDSFRKVDGIKVLSTKTLGDMDGRLKELADIQAIFDHPELESTYYNLSKDKVQSYMNPNVFSRLYNVLSNIKNLDELNDKKFKGFRYLITDSFVKGSSEVLRRMFNFRTNDKNSGTEKMMHPIIVNGISNAVTGKDTPVSKVSAKQRFIQEFNLNLNGIYTNLVPGDAALEAAMHLHSKDNPFVSVDNINLGQQFEIFKSYFLAEVNMSRETDRIVAEGRDNNSLRFFKDILDEETYNKVMEDERSPKIIYDENAEAINSSIETFFMKEKDDMMDILRQYNILQFDVEGKYSLENIPIKGETLEDIENEMYRWELNFAIANIELHKLIYGDPYQYKKELKRTKLFGSPKQELMHNSDQINKVFDRFYNKGFEKGDAGWIDMDKEFFNTVTYDDVLSQNDLPGYGLWKETDGATIVNLKTNKIFGIRTNNWTDDNEKQYKHDMAYQELVESLEEKGKSAEEIKEATTEFEKSNPDIASTYTPRKPSAAGNKESGRSYNSTVTDKTAWFVQSYRLLHQMNADSNALELYKKMEREDVDYAIFLSGRKEGAEVVHKLYDGEKLNQTPYSTEAEQLDPNLPQGIIKIPFSIFGVSVDVPSKEKAATTEGSQMRAIVMMDLIQGGAPLDFVPVNKGTKFNEWKNLSYDEKLKRSELFQEMERNRTILKAKQQHGVDTLFKKLGLTKVSGGYIISDVNKLLNTLKREVFKYNINDNIIKSFNDFKNGTTLLEATPLYSQLRSIIYSIADKQVVRTKISGRQAVQAPSTLLESKRISIKKINGKDVYTSDVLGFYKNDKGQRVCQIGISRWFDSPLSDEELLNLWYQKDNKGNRTDKLTEEGEKIISGIAFRIPTQNKNSIDAFQIGFFLPNGMKDQVIVPSAIVNKVGSDFDIDKLSVYLKNVFTNSKGVNIVPFFGTGPEARTKFGELFDKQNAEEEKRLTGKILKQDELSSLFSDIELGLTSDKQAIKWTPIFKSWFEDEQIDGRLSVRDIEQIFIERIEKYNKKLDELTDKDLQDIAREEFMDKMYKESLENEYIDSLQELVSHPLNFNRMLSPNSADTLKKISEDIVTKTGQVKTDFSSVGNMLKRSFMNTLRHAFVIGKQLVAIAAINQKGHAQRQRVLTYIDPDRPISKKDEKWIGDGQIRFSEYNKTEIDGKMRAVFSLLKDAKGRHYISDINSQILDGSVDVTADNWITGLGIKPNTLSTWLLLIDLGVPIESVSYFMNQPIINDFLNTLEADGKKWLFDEARYNDQMDAYSVSDKYKGIITEIPSETDLFDMLEHNQIGKKASTMNDTQKAQQQFMLTEFMKYAKIAEHSFYVTQGSNYDTARFNDPMLIDQKNWQFNRAKETVISSVEDLLQDSFSGDVRAHLNDIRDAFAEVLTTDKMNSRNTLYMMLFPYFKLDTKNFLKISHKAVNSLIDWVMQNTGSPKFNTFIKQFLLGSDDVKSAVDDIMAYKQYVLEHPDHPLYKNTIINSLALETGKRKNAVDNLYIKGRDGKSYNQNLIIHGFEELKNELMDGTPEEKKLYRKLIHVAVAQSGLTVSPISFTSLLPYEDFKTIYNEAISTLEDRDLTNFLTVNAFQRINYNDNKIVPVVKASTKIIDDKFKPGYKKILRFDEDFLDKKIKNAIKAGKLPKLIERNTQSQYGDSDFILYSYQESLPAEELAKRRKTNNYSYAHKVLMKRVYTEDKDGNRIPYIYTTEDSKGREYEKQLYKAINPWGDGIYANESYDKLIPEDEDSTIGRPSVLDNGIDKVQKKVNGEIVTAEVEDQTILDIINDVKQEYDLMTDQEIPADAPIYDVISNREYTPENIGSLKPNEVFVFGSNTEGRHGLGNALTAKNRFGAIQYQAKGLQGQSYAIVTKDLKKGKKSVSLDDIAESLYDFMDFAEKHPELKFYVTKLGSQLAGYTIKDMKAEFEALHDAEVIPDNVILPKEYEVRDGVTNGDTASGPINRLITFRENTVYGYPDRTTKNASADATLHLAYNFNNAGEKLTKKAVEDQKKKYIPMLIPSKEKSTKDFMPHEKSIQLIVDRLNEANAKSINIAGNGIYTLKEGKYTQDDIDTMIYNLMKAVTESPNLKTKIESVVTGGQTGIDEAGAKATARLGIPTMVLAPKGWMFRNEKFQDISDNEISFKRRFGDKNAPDGLPPIDRTSKTC